MYWWGAFKDRDDWPTTCQLLVLYVQVQQKTWSALSTRLWGSSLLWHKWTGELFRDDWTCLTRIIWATIGRTRSCGCCAGSAESVGALDLNPMVRFISSHWHKCLLYLAPTQNLVFSQDGVACVCVGSAQTLEGMKSLSQCNEVKYKI